MSKITKLVTAHAFDCLSLIAEIIDHTRGGDHATMQIAFSVIKTIVESVKGAHERVITPEEARDRVEKAVQQLEDSIEKNKADALAQLDKKFPEKPEPKTDPDALLHSDVVGPLR